MLSHYIYLYISLYIFIMIQFQFALIYNLVMSYTHTQNYWFSSVAQSCPTFCDPMDCSIPGFPVHHQLSELAKTLVHRVGDVIQSSHPLSSPSPPAFNLSQHQDLFQWVGSSHLVANIGVSASASVLPVNIQGWFPLGLTGLISLKSKGLFKSFQHHSLKTSILWHSAFFMVQLSHPYIPTEKNHSFD